MQENAICFIRIRQGTYEQITYKELEKRRKRIQSYNKRKFIYIHGMLLEVLPKEYIEYYKEVERSRYINKVLKKLRTISIEKLNYDENNKDKEVIVDDALNIECQIERKLEKERLQEALMQLDNTEYNLIKAIYFENKTVREYAKILGVSHGTIQYRKEQILKKLRKILKT